MKKDSEASIFSLTFLIFCLYVSIIISSLIYLYFDPEINLKSIIYTGYLSHLLGFLSLFLSLFLYVESYKIIDKRLFLEDLTDTTTNIKEFFIYLFPEFHTGILFSLPVYTITILFVNVNNNILLEGIYIYSLFLGVSIGINLYKIVIYYIN